MIEDISILKHQIHRFEHGSFFRNHIFCRCQPNLHILKHLCRMKFSIYVYYMICLVLYNLCHVFSGYFIWIICVWILIIPNNLMFFFATMIIIETSLLTICLLFLNLPISSFVLHADSISMNMSKIYQIFFKGEIYGDSPFFVHFEVALWKEK